MELKRLTEHIWYMPFEEERDRPNLGYVKGDNFSIAIDAGHSAAHTREFYNLLKKEELPLPGITVLTHWHWDHTFGMHAAHGLCLANEKTNHYLKEWKDRIEKNGPEEFFALHESIRREYRENRQVTVKTADIVFSEEISLNLGGCTVRILQTEAPHTDDSTLIYICEDKTLFIGDSTGHEFFTGVKRKDLCQKLADTFKKIDPEICIEGHWIPESTEEVLSDLLM